MRDEYIKEAQKVIHDPNVLVNVVSRRVKQLRRGDLYDSRCGTRQRGVGPFAALLKPRFQKARRRYGLEREVALRCDKFVPPRLDERQIELGL